MWRAGLLLACLALALASADAAPGAQPLSPDQSLRSFLQGRFRQEQADLRASRGQGSEIRYARAFADLNGDGTPEALVYDMGACGTGGCDLFVLVRRGGAWRIVTHISITHPPIRVLETRSHGWRDLGVRVAGGGISGYDALLAFNGRAYPDNPSGPPARRLIRAVPGRIVITADDRGQPLF